MRTSVVLLRNGAQRIVLRAALLACTVLAALCCTAAAFAAPQTAWADDGYSISIDTSSVPGSLAVGDEFTVSEVLAKNGADQFTMYALSSSVSYDAGVLELVSCNAPSVGVATIQNGAVVYNALASVFAGEVTNSPIDLCDITFRVVGEGDAYVGFDRASVSTYSGMTSYPLSATGVTVSVASSTPVTPADPVTPDGSGTSDASDEGRDSAQSFADNVRSDPTTAYDETLKAEDVKRLEDAGFTDAELVSLGFTQDELDRARNGEEVTPTLNSKSEKANSKSGSKDTTSLNGSDGSTAQSSNGIPWVLVIVIVVVAIGAIVAVVVGMRLKKRE